MYSFSLVAETNKMIYQGKICLPMEKITDENDTKIMVNTRGYRLSGTKYCIAVSLNTVAL
jgi:hypothetical protein